MGLSVIIPALNEERYIGKLLDCLCRQTYRDFEVIVVDGGSEDNTKEVVFSYKDNLDIRFYRFSKRPVLAKARNKGVMLSNRGLLLFFDADASFSDDYIEKSLNEFYKRGLDFAGSIQYPSLNYWYYSILYRAINTVGRLLQKVYPMTHGSCSFYKKGIIKKIGGFDESLLWLDDKELGKRAKKVGKFGLLHTSIIDSVRRFEKHGTKKTMLKWGKAWWEYMVGDIKDTNRIKYEFGHYGK